jgi:Flp pilus assembly protein TadB
MANCLSITAANESLNIFECPVCKQTIGASTEKCPYCSTTIDRATAQAAVEKLSRINQACSDASFLRTMAISILAFLGIMLIPFFGLLGIVGYYFLLIAVPVLAIRWWLRFHALRTDDREFSSARTTVIVISALIVIPIIGSLVRLF